MPSKSTIEQRYLLHPDGTIYIYTDALAGRKGMVECSKDGKAFRPEANPSLEPITLKDKVYFLPPDAHAIVDEMASKFMTTREELAIAKAELTELRKSYEIERARAENFSEEAKLLTKQVKSFERAARKADKEADKDAMAEI